MLKSEDYKNKIYIGGVYPGFIKTDILQRQLDNAQNHKVVGKFMMPLEKATKKITNSLHKKKKRIVFGYQARSMSLLSRLFPKTAPSIITNVFRLSKFDLFDDVFDKKEK